MSVMMDLAKGGKALETKAVKSASVRTVVGTKRSASSMTWLRMRESRFFQ